MADLQKATAVRRNRGNVVLKEAGHWLISIFFLLAIWYRVGLALAGFATLIIAPVTIRRSYKAWIAASVQPD